MKTPITVVLFTFLFVSAIAQNAVLKPGYANISLIVKDAKGNPVIHKKVRLVNTDLSVTKEGHTDSTGTATIAGKVNSNYELYFGNGNVPQKFFIPETPYQEIEIPIVYDPLKSEKIVPGANEVVLNISLVDYSSIPMSKTVTLENKLTKQKYTLTTDVKGVGQVLVPKAAELIVHFKEAQNYSVIPLPAEGGIIYNYTLKFPSDKGWKKYPSNTMGLINFTFKDLYGGAAPGETFYVTTSSSTTKYTCKTDSNGFAQVLLPLGFQYSLSETHNPDFKQVIVKKTNPTDVFIVNVEYISATEAQRKANEERRQRIEAIRDSLSRADPSVLNFDFNLNQVAEIEGTAQTYFKRLKHDPKVFEKENKTVLAVLNRFKSDWKDKIIVVDVTGSMSTYINDVTVWLALQKMENETNRYVFFNDGDAKSTAEKIIGKTGGVYTIKSNNLEEVLNALVIAKAKGSGGDSPENDVEALLLAQSLKSDISEIILVADNYCNMRDYSLIKELKVPVRVIACGATSEASVNEQYINLAYKTGGSIHTLTEDIMDLALKNEGDTVIIGGKKYVLRNGEFFLLEK